jgi:hypothetical protein
VSNTTTLYREWLRGFTVALASLTQFREDTIYDEVVSSGEPEALIRLARRDGTLRWSGLSGYVRRNPKGSE